MSLQRKNQRVQMSLDLSPELYENLKNVVQQFGGDTAEVLLQGIVLMQLVVEVKEKGKHLWITDDNKNLETELLAFKSMSDCQLFSALIANQGTNPLLLSSVSLQLQEDADLERKLRELKAKQELRKDWLLFIFRDIVFFSVALIFILAVGIFSLFFLIKR
jgi:hypothetical protein